MRKRFWQFVHNRLEDAWHWVYYTKLAEPSPLTNPGHVNYQYKFTYVCGKDAMLSWANAGGPNECEHGYAEGIKCPTCSKLD
jgi:hypothetical protein